MKTKYLILAVVASALFATQMVLADEPVAPAGNAAQNGQVHQDREALKADRQKLREDRQKLRKDRREARQDRRQERRKAKMGH